MAAAVRYLGEACQITLPSGATVKVKKGSIYGGAVAERLRELDPGSVRDVTPIKAIAK